MLKKIYNFLKSCISVDEENNYNYFVESYEPPSMINSAFKLNTYTPFIQQVGSDSVNLLNLNQEIPSNSMVSYKDFSQSSVNNTPWQEPIEVKKAETEYGDFTNNSYQRFPYEYEVAVSREESLFYTTDSQLNSHLYL